MSNAQTTVDWAVPGTGDQAVYSIMSVMDEVPHLVIKRKINPCPPCPAGLDGGTLLTIHNTSAEPIPYTMIFAEDGHYIIFVIEKAITALNLDTGVALSTHITTPDVKVTGLYLDQSGDHIMAVVTNAAGCVCPHLFKLTNGVIETLQHYSMIPAHRSSSILTDQMRWDGSVFAIPVGQHGEFTYGIDGKVSVREPND